MNRRLAWELFQTLVLTLMIFFAVRVLVRNFAVHGDQMSPQVNDGTYLLLYTAAYDKQRIKRGDVVLHTCRPGSIGPYAEYVARVVGLPGEHVEVVGDNVRINGQEQASTIETAYDPRQILMA